MYSKRDRKKLRKTFPTKSAAKEWRSDAIVAVRKQQLRATTAVTVDHAVRQWLEGARSGFVRSRSGDVYKPGSLRAYETGWRLRVSPVLGSMRLSEVTRRDLQDLVDELVVAGLKPSTVVVTINALSVVYRRALQRNEITINPTAGLELPAVRAERDRVASPEECALLLHALSDRDRALWATAMYAGLRRGELTALRIEDIDLERGVIYVRRGWDIVEGEISTKSGRERKVPIASLLRSHLQQHLRRIIWDEGLVFGLSGSKPFHGTPTAKRAERAWAAVGLQRITLHECRHTFASLMIEAGVNAKALATYMGHANISFTFDRYGHLLPGNEDETALLLDDYLVRRAPRLRQPRSENGHETGSNGHAHAGPEEDEKPNESGRFDGDAPSNGSPLSQDDAAFQDREYKGAQVAHNDSPLSQDDAAFQDRESDGAQVAHNDSGPSQDHAAFENHESNGTQAAPHGHCEPNGDAPAEDLASSGGKTSPDGDTEAGE